MPNEKSDLRSAEVRLCAELLERYRRSRIEADGDEVLAIRALNQAFYRHGYHDYRPSVRFGYYVVEQYEDGYVEVPSPSPLAAYAVAAKNETDAIESCGAQQAGGYWMATAQTVREVQDDPDFWTNLDMGKPVEWDGPTYGKPSPAFLGG